jgi:hypothetical protein
MREILEDWRVSSTPCLDCFWAEGARLHSIVDSGDIRLFLEKLLRCQRRWRHYFPLISATRADGDFTAPVRVTAIPSIHCLHLGI